MIHKFIVKYLLYLGRWQLSTPLIASILSIFSGIEGVILANFIGGLIFFWLDKKILEEKKDKLLQKYLMYLFRWQLTSITLYPVTQVLGEGIFGVIIAQIIGGLIFFWVDRWIFTGKIVPIFWEVKEDVICKDCNKKVIRGYRIVKATGYDRTKDNLSEFRCEACSIKKTQALRERGVQV